ncbi:unnamed protein product [Phytophthora lilii]|uniref:Unnamed protein product n=1 Tax=Phytophthora lilii TaxID=2077276 RepID=A0A9W6TK39_9STRA|nr:unnamed protein product [Phytophthora lilii]
MLVPRIVASVHVLAQVSCSTFQVSLPHVPTGYEPNASLRHRRRDFPRLNGRNFVIWKTRVTAALEGKNLLGFVTQVDYAGDFDFDISDDEELNPALSDKRDMEAALDAAGAPKADDAEDTSSSESFSDASSETATAGDDGDVDMGKRSPPVIQSFSATKQEEKKRAEKLRAKSLKQSSKRLRRSEAKAKAFLIKTIDDQHVLMVKDKTTAFDIFQTLCDKYEGAAIHGDPYYIQSYLMTLKYEEDMDLTAFFFQMESAMESSAEATNNVCCRLTADRCYMGSAGTLYHLYPLTG